MKDRLKPCPSFFILTAMLLICGHPLSGQQKLSISAGFGFPDLLNVSARYHHDQSQFGLIIGSMPLSDESILSAGADARYHFGGTSSWTDMHPWYGRIGLNYLRDETPSLIGKDVYLNTRIGREFNISKRFGIDLDLGTMFQLYHYKTRKKPSNGWDLDIHFPVLPSLGAGMFYRL